MNMPHSPPVERRGGKSNLRDVSYYAIVTKRISFGSGVVLKPGDRVHVDCEVIKGDGAGIKWTDRDGTHVAAVRASLLERTL